MIKMREELIEIRNKALELRTQVGKAFYNKIDLIIRMVDDIAARHSLGDLTKDLEE